jgi:Protein of unknown function (DUF3040)
MPLSDKERQTLDDIEQALLLEDPEFVAGATMDRLRERRLWRWIGLGLLGLLGAVVLVTGLVLTHAWLVPGVVVSKVGVLMMVGAAWKLIPWNRRA